MEIIAEEFERLLMLPHMRSYSIESILKMERGEHKGRSTSSLRASLSESQENELVHLLANPPKGIGMGPRHFRELANDQMVDRQIRQLMIFHGLDTSRGCEEARTSASCRQ